MSCLGLKKNLVNSRNQDMQDDTVFKIQAMFAEWDGERSRDDTDEIVKGEKISCTRLNFSEDRVQEIEVTLKSW